MSLRNKRLEPVQDYTAQPPMAVPAVKVSDIGHIQRSSAWLSEQIAAKKDLE
jgi:hypothetical protein